MESLPQDKLVTKYAQALNKSILWSCETLNIYLDEISRQAVLRYANALVETLKNWEPQNNDHLSIKGVRVKDNTLTLLNALPHYFNQ